MVRIVAFLLKIFLHLASQETAGGMLWGRGPDEDLRGGAEYGPGIKEHPYMAQRAADRCSGWTRGPRESPSPLCASVPTARLGHCSGPEGTHTVPSKAAERLWEMTVET